MNYFFFDASALAKRYIAEIGSDAVDLIFNKTAPARTCCLLLGVGETTSILVRARNGGKLSPPEFQKQIATFHSEIVNNDEFLKFDAERAEIYESFELIEKFSINATDAIVLRIALTFKATAEEIGQALVLVCSDKRLIRAAEKSGITVCDPEQVTLAEVQRLIDAE